MKILNQKNLTIFIVIIIVISEIIGIALTTHVNNLIKDVPQNIRNTTNLKEIPIIDIKMVIRYLIYAPLLIALYKGKSYAKGCLSILFLISFIIAIVIAYRLLTLEPDYYHPDLKDFIEGANIVGYYSIGIGLISVFFVLLVNKITLVDVDEEKK